MLIDTNTAWVVKDLMKGKVGTGNLLPYNYENIYTNLPAIAKQDLSQDEFYAESEKLISSELQKGKRVQNPFLLHMGGVPGAGKTYELQKMNLANTVLIQFDGIMERLSLYKQAVEKTDKSNKSELDNIFSIWEKPAFVIAWKLEGRALKDNYPIAIDSAGHSDEQYNLLTSMQKRGTKVGMYYIDISIDNALKRAEIRMKETGRSVPAGMIETRHKLLENLMPKYKKELDIFFYLKAQHDSKGNPIDPTLTEVWLEGENQNPPLPTDIITCLKETSR